ncbi:MAG TPA: cytochrome P450 [Acidimicrobiales bacterium]|nr:cytochrome P450 [Acidimicrobiales bacterium]
MSNEMTRREVAEAFNPLDSAFAQDPGPVLAAARRDEPVFFAPAVNAWVVTRFSDVEAILRDPRRFTNKDILSIDELLSPEVKALVSGRIPMEGTLSGLDGDTHTRLRRVLSHAFSTKRIAELELEVSDLTWGLLEPLRRHGTSDLVDELCYPLPLVTITRLIGIPDEELPLFRQGVDDWGYLTLAYVLGADVTEQLAAAQRLIDLHDRIEELFDERRVRPRNDLLGEIVAREHTENLTRREMLSLVPGLFLAGHETIAQSLAMGLYQLLSDRQWWQALVDDPGCVESVIEEMLRRDGPVFGMLRNVTEDCEISGVAVPAGSRLYLCYWSANLDDARYDEPEEFDVLRASRLHLAFARGIHYCIGAPLARMELRVALTTLAREHPNLRLQNGFVPTYSPRFFLRGATDLRVETAPSIS